ncbi:MAG: type IV pilus secretin PilQ [Deltaproteobacteria bacterium]|nr:type IV pilus secretin PilQ [Deltaproteobacteria bacterium]
MISNVRTKLINLCSLLLLATVLFGGANSVQASSMVTVTSVDISTGSVVLNTDSQLVVFKSYTLGAPSRLVVDVENALPEFSDRKFTINDGFKSLRIGLYADKTRFVFDALNDVLPDARVEQVDGKLIIAWGVQDKVVTAPVVPGTPNAVEQIDFDASNGQSVFTVSLSSQAELITPTVDDDVIRFGLKDTVIPRSLRRVVDASVFPSAVLQITPYSTIIAGERSVMFAARMKGPVDYTVNLVGSSLVFRTSDGPFAEAPAVKLSTVVVPVEVDQETEPVNDSDDVAQVLESLNNSSQSVESEASSFGAGIAQPKVYTGEPVTLVFDDADIRKVMQLLAEISDQNIILSDGVSGNISLRLHDVPWDQALDLVLEIKELGTIDQGNVVRVLPLKQIEAMETARLQAKQTIKRLEETQTEIFEVNYKDPDSVEGVIDDILSDQGEVQVIEGSKKIMVNDIPSKIEEIRALLDILDVPVKQVMIEARIVEVDKTSEASFGIHWGIDYDYDPDGSNSTEAIGSSLDTAQVGLGGSFSTPTTVSEGLGAAMNFGRLGANTLVLDLQLAALEASGNGKVISSPKVLTLDGETARIGQGSEIPYKSVSDSGTTTEFKKAELALEVTPLVNPDNTVLLEILATNSTPGVAYADGVAINTKEAETTLLLKNGETTVIGGIYTENIQDGESGTPFLKDIPYFGYLFKYKTKSKDRSELLIFITPHIIE